LHNLILCSTVKDPHTRNTKYYVPSGQIPWRDVVHASVFRFGQIMTNNWKS